MAVLLTTLAALLAINLLLAGAVFGARIHNEVRAAQWSRREAVWYPAHLDLIAGSVSEEDLQARVSDRELHPVLSITARFTRRVSGEGRDRLRRFAEPLLARLRPRFKSHRAERRAEFLALFAELTDEGHLDEVRHALQDPSPLVAMVAARALVKRPTRRGATESVLAELSRFENWDSEYLASLLADMGPEGAHHLREAMADPGMNALTRRITALALARQRDLAAADVASAVLAESGGDRELTAACLRVIEAVGKGSHIGAVRDLINHPDFVIRARAVSALGRIGSSYDARIAVPLLADDSAWVAINAAQALRRLGRSDILQGVAQGDDSAAKTAAEILMEATP